MGHPVSDLCKRMHRFVCILCIMCYLRKKIRMLQANFLSLVLGSVIFHLGYEKQIRKSGSFLIVLQCGDMIFPAVKSLLFFLFLL